MSSDYSDPKAPLWETLMIAVGIGSGAVSILILLVWICFSWLPTRSKDRSKMADTISHTESKDIGPEEPRSSIASSIPRAWSFDNRASFDILSDLNKSSSRNIEKGNVLPVEAFSQQQPVIRFENYEDHAAAWRSRRDSLVPSHRPVQQGQDKLSAGAMAAAWRQQAHALSTRDEHIQTGNQDESDDLSDSTAGSVACQPPLLCGFGRCV